MRSAGQTGHWTRSSTRFRWAVWDDGSEPLGNVLKVGPNCFMAVPKAFINWTHTKEPRHLPGSYRTLRDAIADLAREWDRQNPSRSKAMGRPPLPPRVGNISMPSLVDRTGPPHHRPKAIPRTGFVGVWDRDAIWCTTRLPILVRLPVLVFQGKRLAGNHSAASTRRSETGRWRASAYRWAGRHSTHRTRADAARSIVDNGFQAPPPLEYKFDEEDEDTDRTEDAVDCPSCDQWGADPSSCPRATIGQNHVQPSIWSGSWPISPPAPSPSSSLTWKARRDRGSVIGRRWRSHGPP